MASVISLTFDVLVEHEQNAANVLSLDALWFPRASRTKDCRMGKPEAKSNRRIQRRFRHMGQVFSLLRTHSDVDEMNL